MAHDCAQLLLSRKRNTGVCRLVQAVIFFLLHRRTMQSEIEMQSPGSSGTSRRVTINLPHLTRKQKKCIVCWSLLVAVILVVMLPGFLY